MKKQTRNNLFEAFGFILALLASISLISAGSSVTEGLFVYFLVYGSFWLMVYIFGEYDETHIGLA